MDEVEIRKNAFLLFYEREAPFNPNPPEPNSEGVPATPKRKSSSVGNAAPEPAVEIPEVPSLSDSEKEVWKQNERVVRQQQRFDPKLFDFLACLAHDRRCVALLVSCAPSATAVAQRPSPVPPHVYLFVLLRAARTLLGGGAWARSHLVPTQSPWWRCSASSTRTCDRGTTSSASTSFGAWKSCSKCKFR